MGVVIEMTQEASRSRFESKPLICLDQPLEGTEASLWKCLNLTREQEGSAIPASSYSTHTEARHPSTQVPSRSPRPPPFKTPSTQARLQQPVARKAR